MTDEFYVKYKNLKSRAKSEGKPFSLTLDDYIQLAKEAGITALDIGQHDGNYHMSRIGDSGGYEIGNCRFIPMVDNLKERSINGGAKLGGLKITGHLNPNYGKFGSEHPSYGHTKSEEFKKSASERVSGDRNPMFGKKSTLTQDSRSKAIKSTQEFNLNNRFTCEHCGKSNLIKGNYLRWHSNKCRSKK